MNNKKFKAFIDEGMHTYKKASEVAALFRTEIENILKTTIIEREDWGSFTKKKMKQPQSSKYWTEYPYINANIDGKHKGQEILIRLAISWYGSSTDYPHYSDL